MASGVLVQDILISMLSMYLVFVISEVVHYLIFNHGYSSNRDTKDIQDISKHFSKEVEKYMGPFMDIISVDSTDPLKTKNSIFRTSNKKKSISDDVRYYGFEAFYDKRKKTNNSSSKNGYFGWLFTFVIIPIIVHYTAFHAYIGLKTFILIILFIIFFQSNIDYLKENPQYISLGLGIVSIIIVISSLV
tara:strand:- start:17 stop:583 length:567 start_codon:yes stop_codon:yes gene_type:complete